jgi:transcriptional regulator with XRE-family HTH domain
MTLAEFRKRFPGVSQEAVAKRMGVTQTVVARLANADNIFVEKLWRYVRGVAGVAADLGLVDDGPGRVRIEIVAVIGETRYPLDIGFFGDA